LSVGKSELLKRSLEKGTSFIDMTRERAELLVKELVDAGVVRKGQAEKAIDVVVDRSRKRSEAFGNLIRHEVAEQLSAFGVATKDDIARLEMKLDSSDVVPGGTASRVKESRDAKEAPITKSVGAKRETKGARRPAATPAMKPDSGRAGAGPESSGPR
jgi:polyhydroxyalkanoate synthesis regulator phasin